MSKILWKASDWSTFLTVCLFKCVLKLFEPEDAKLHCFTFLQCAFSYGSSNCLREKTQNHTSCICLTFVQCVFSHGSSKNLDQCRHNHTGCICWTFRHCAFSYVSSNGLPARQFAYFRRFIITQAAFVWLFSTVRFRMCPQNVRPRGCIITQVAFVWFFPVFIGNSFTEILLHWIIMLKVLFHRHKWKGLSPVAVSFKLRKFNLKFLGKRKWKWN